MTGTGALTIVAHGEREIVMTRGFDAPRHVVFQAHTTPALLKRWLGVFGDWSMTTCDMEVRPGGRYRWEWTNRQHGRRMAVQGEVREVTRPERLVMTERFDDAWYPGQALSTTTFTDQGERTLLTQTVEYESQEARDGVLATPMASGVVKSFQRMSDILPSLAAGRWIEAPELATSDHRRTAVIRLQVAPAEISRALPPAIGEVIGAARAQGVGPAGPIVAHYLAVGDGLFDVEVGVPVTGEVSPAGRVSAGALPEARVARTVYHGPYEGLHGAWAEFDAWLAEQGLATRRSLWEIYAVGPDTSADPADWRTELVRPLAE